MKLNYDIIKAILEEVETDTDGIHWYEWTFDSFCKEKLSLDPDRIDKMTQQEFNASQEQEKNNFNQYAEYVYHFRLLIDDVGLIDGKIQDYSGGASIIFRGLSMQGHETLDAMRNDTLWKRIRENAKAVGVEGLKQLPALALQLLQGASS